MIFIPFMAPTIRFSLWPEGLIAHSGEHMAAGAIEYHYFARRPSRMKES
jgi:hypothetical protein